MFKQMVLENGMRVVTENVPYARTVSMGIFVRAGSMYESSELNGISHFIEHLVFKGTSKRTAKDIANEMDNMGGFINAYTGRESTCFYTNVLSEYVECAFEIVSDIVQNAVFNQSDIDLERKVILEEIAMYEDSPEDLVADLLCEACFNGHPVAMPILGTDESLANIGRKQILEYFNERYVAQNIVISFAGAIEDDTAFELAKKYFGGLNCCPENPYDLPTPNFQIASIEKKKDIEQTHIMFAFEGLTINDDLRYSLLVANSVLGGGMSSNLFQAIREQNGLAYSIYSYTVSAKDHGMLCIYAGTMPHNTEQVKKMIWDELIDLKNNGISEDQLNKTKNQFRCSYLMGKEKFQSVMRANGTALLVDNRIITEQEFLDKLQAVTVESVQSVLEKIISKNKASYAIVGKI